MKSGVFNISIVLRPWFLLVLLFIIVALWSWGGISFQLSYGWFAGIFGPIADLQNVFSPVSALFAGIAVWGAIYTIFTQLVLSSRQQFETVFFNMLNIHNENKREMLFPRSLDPGDREDYKKGVEAFVKYYDLLKSIYFYINHKTSPGLHRLPLLNSKIQADIDDNLGQSVDENGIVGLCKEELFSLAYDIFTQNTDMYYSNYARHLYITLKYINENADLVKDKFTYFRILRAQLSIHEATLLYYRAITSPDKIDSANGCSKYQNLIEEAKFLHLLCDNKSMLFDNGLAGSMRESAFGC